MPKRLEDLKVFPENPFLNYNSEIIFDQHLID